MYLRDLLLLAAKNLVRMKVRVIISIFGAAIGTAAVILLVAFGLGLEQNMRRNMGSVGDLTLMRVSPPMELPAPTGGSQHAAGNQQPVLNLNTLQEFWQIPGVDAVSPQEHLALNCVINIQGYQAYSPIFGIDPDQVHKLGLQPNSGDLQLGSGEVIVGAKAFDNLFDPRRKTMTLPDFDPAGQTIELEMSRFTEEAEQTAPRKVRLRISAVLKETGGGIDYMVFIPLTESRRWNEWGLGKRINYRSQGYQTILVKTASIETVPQVTAAIESMGFFVDSPKKMIDELNRTFAVLKLMLGGIGAVALVVSAFGIANTMIMSIYERTREIGLLKSLGATNFDILSLFLIEAGCIGVIGGLSGVGAAMLAGHLANASGSAFFSGIFSVFAAGPGMFDIGTNSLVIIPAWLVYTALLFSLAVGLVSGVYPAARAATMDPMHALKQE